MKRFRFRTAMLRTTLLTFALASSVMGAKANDFFVNGVKYSTTENGNAKIAVQIPDSVRSVVNIPAQVSDGQNTYTVNELAGGAFTACLNLTTITLPASLEIIGVTEINPQDYQDRYERPSDNPWPQDFPSSYTGSGAFAGCINLTTANLSECQFTETKGAMFAGCTNLTSVSMPNSLMTLTDYDFLLCKNLRTINLENTALETIGDYTFHQNTAGDGLQYVYVPATLTTIGISAFYRNDLRKITDLGTGNRPTDITGKPYLTLDSDISLVSHLSNVSSIGEYAFSANWSMGSIIVPNLNVLNNNCFASCFNIYWIILGNDITTIGDMAFSGLGNMHTLTSTSLGNTIVNNQTLNGVSGLHFPATLTSIGKKSFYGCTGFTDVYCMSNPAPTLYRYEALTSLGETTLSFSKNTNATLHYPNGANGYSGKGIANTSAQRCWGYFFTNRVPFNLTNLAPVRRVESVANEHQENLTYKIDENTLLTFFDGLAYKLELKDGEGDGIDGCATLLCTNKYAFSYEGEDSGLFFDYLLELIGDCTDENVWSKIGLTHLLLINEEYPALGGDIVIPETITYNEKVYKVTAIEAGAFYSGEVSQITSISLPNTITHVGTETTDRGTLGVGDIDEKVLDASHLFAMSSKLKKVVAPVSVYERLTAGDFANCPVLTTIATTDNPEAEGFYIPSSKKSIGQFSFTNCKKLTAVTLPEDIETIGTSAFAGTGLTSITLPETLKEISYNAFKDAPIANVVVKSVSLKQSSPKAFDNPSTISVTVPFDYKDVFTAAGFAEANITVVENGGHKRTVTEGNWGTVCLPYDLDVERDSEYGAEFYAIDRKIMNGTEVSAIELVQLEEGETLQAGVPYFFKATGTELVLPYKDFYTAIAQSAGSYNGLHGAIEATAISDDDINDGVYMLKSNTLYKADEGSKCGANRAYVKMSEVSETSYSSAAARRIRIDVNDDTTGILFLENGQSNMSPSAVYDLSGRRVNTNAAQKGIYIVNGKKIIK